MVRKAKEVAQRPGFGDEEGDAERCRRRDEEEKGKMMQNGDSEHPDGDGDLNRVRTWPRVRVRTRPRVRVRRVGKGIREKGERMGRGCTRARGLKPKGNGIGKDTKDKG